MATNPSQAKNVLNERGAVGLRGPQNSKIFMDLIIRNACPSQILGAEKK